MTDKQTTESPHHANPETNARDSNPSGDVTLPDGLTRVVCECGRGIITNKPDDVDACRECRE